MAREIVCLGHDGRAAATPTFRGGLQAVPDAAVRKNLEASD